MDDCTSHARYDVSAQRHRWLLHIIALIGRVKFNMNARRDAKYLSSLNDRCLSDFGISRCSIDHAVKHGRTKDCCTPRDDRLRSALETPSSRSS